MKKVIHSLLDDLGSAVLRGPWGKYQAARCFPAAEPKALNLNQVKRAVIFAPHPDDEIFGAALLLKELARRQVSVDLVFVSSGQKYTARDGCRVQEAIACAQRHGASPHFLGFMDGQLQQHLPDLVQAFSPYLHHADLVVAPAWTDYHSDHQAVSQALLKALPSALPLRLLFYCTFSPLWPHYPISYLEGQCGCFHGEISCYQASASPRGVASFNLIREIQGHRYLGKEVFWEPYWELQTGDLANLPGHLPAPTLRTPSHWRSFLKALKRYNHLTISNLKEDEHGK